MNGYRILSQHYLDLRMDLCFDRDSNKICIADIIVSVLHRWLTKIRRQVATRSIYMAN